jgi:hypothetical protein
VNKDFLPYKSSDKRKKWKEVFFMEKAPAELMKEFINNRNSPAHRNHGSRENNVRRSPAKGDGERT